MLKSLIISGREETKSNWCDCVKGWQCKEAAHPPPTNTRTSAVKKGWGTELDKYRQDEFLRLSRIGTLCEYKRAMSSDQVPPPSANFSFPPGDSKLHFNYIDSFVTSWVTPALSKDPCIFSLYYWNGSNPSGEWTSSTYQKTFFPCSNVLSAQFWNQ